MIDRHTDCRTITPKETHGKTGLQPSKYRKNAYIRKSVSDNKTPARGLRVWMLKLQYQPRRPHSARC